MPAGRAVFTGDGKRCANPGAGGGGCREGELIAFGAHVRCPPLPRQLAQRKAWSALRFRRPTATLAQEVSAGALQLAVFNDPQLLAMPGGEPVIVDGLAIGGVGISGLPPELDAGLAARFVQRLT